MNALLKIKHWQLFLILVIIPLTVVIIFSVKMISEMIPIIDSLDIEGNPFSFLSGMQNEMIGLTVLILFISFIGYAWSWSVSILLQEKLPQRLQIDTSRFKALFAIYIICTIVINVFSLIYVKDLFENGIDLEGFNESNINTFSAFTNIIQLVLFGIYIYIAFFISKVIKTCELKRETQIGDFAVEMFFVIFFFIGVWFLQPRINKINNEELIEDEIALEDNLVL